jgi:hypothetical protein
MDDKSVDEKDFGKIQKDRLDEMKGWIKTPSVPQLLTTLKPYSSKAFDFHYRNHCQKQ